MFRLCRFVNTAPATSPLLSVGVTTTRLSCSSGLINVTYTCYKRTVITYNGVKNYWKPLLQITECYVRTVMEVKHWWHSSYDRRLSVWDRQEAFGHSRVSYTSRFTAMLLSYLMTKHDLH